MNAFSITLGGHPGRALQLDVAWGACRYPRRAPGGVRRLSDDQIAYLRGLLANFNRLIHPEQRP